jgi:hypothetical protein
MNHPVGFNPNRVLLRSEPGESEVGSQNQSPDSHEDQYGSGKEAERRVAIAKRTLQEERKKERTISPMLPPTIKYEATTTVVFKVREEPIVCLMS